MTNVLAKMGRLRTLFESGRMTNEEFEEARLKIIRGQPVHWLDGESSTPLHDTNAENE